MRIVSLFHCFIVSLLIGLLLAGCQVSDVGSRRSEVGGRNSEIRNPTSGMVVFFLDVDGEVSEIEMPAQERYTAYDILNLHVEKEGIVLKTKKYDFGMFIQGIGDKVGDMNSFWLFYVNGELANASVDNTVVEPGDVVRFEFSNL